MIIEYKAIIRIEREGENVFCITPEGVVKAYGREVFTLTPEETKELREKIDK